jgi:hypothetical protein
MPVRTTARMAAFMPGASPPLVSTAIRFISHSRQNHRHTSRAVLGPPCSDSLIQVMRVTAANPERVQDEEGDILGASLEHIEPVPTQPSVVTLPRPGKNPGLTIVIGITGVCNPSHRADPRLCVK